MGSEFAHVPYIGLKRTERPSQVDQLVGHDVLPNGEPTRQHSHPPTPRSKEPNETIVGLRAAKGLGRIFKAAARAPGTFTVAMAQGAHNAPRMWGDKTVRPQDKVTGVVSGVVAGCKVSLHVSLLAWLCLSKLAWSLAVVLTWPVRLIQELAFGTYDGIAGLFTQPVIGAMEEGPLGFVKGFGKGVMGTPFKFWAGTLVGSFLHSNGEIEMS
jgi:hypothetical protein